MKRTLIAFILFHIISCKPNLTYENKCNLDSLDYNIYTILVNKYVLPEVDSSLRFDETNGKFRTIKNSRRNLLLIDSTKTYKKLDRNSLLFLTKDASLLNNFIETNSSKCHIDSCFNTTIKLHKISRIRFDNYFNHNTNSGYSKIYNDYQDVAGILEFSKICYSVDRRIALVEICFFRSPKNSFGLFILLNFQKGKWVVMSEETDWVS